MKKTSEVRDELVRLLGTITREPNVDGGYENDWDAEKIFPYWSKTKASDMRDASYPKTFVVMEDGSTEMRIGEEVFKTLRFTIIHIVKKTASDDDSQAMVDSYLSDLERFFELNSTLSGFVNTAELVTFETDGGVVEKEATIICRVKTERSKYGNP